MRAGKIRGLGCGVVADHEAGAGEHAALVRDRDAAVDAAAHAEVVGVDDEEAALIHGNVLD